MKSDPIQLSVPLSRLVPSRRNPRKVKPGRDAHRRLVALIRSQGLLQRIKLATLAMPVKAAHREGRINTAMAEAFAAVPQDRQLEVWQELHSNPRHAEQVRNVIANAWINAEHTLFDLSVLPELAVSRDLFGDRVLIQRKAFMEAPAAALNIQRHTLTEEGWSEVMVGPREEVQDRLYATDTCQREFDAKTTHACEDCSQAGEARNRFEEDQG
jgi:ribosomal protein L22